MERSYIDRIEAIAEFADSRRGTLMGAIVSHLAALSDDELRRVPFDRVVFADYLAFTNSATVDLSSVSLQQVDRHGEPIDPAACSFWEEHVVSFDHILRRPPRRDEAIDGRDSLDEAEWASMGRAEMLQRLVHFLVAIDPIHIMAHELELDGFFASEF
jgi:hypothetical protein